MSVSLNENSSRGSKKRRQENETINSPRKAPRLDESASASGEEDQDELSARSTNRHTRKERKQNRSTRIHSLRKLLARGKLPSTVQQEKERELASLIHEQEKTKSKKEAKKTLERYHYVRFVERQKAEKRLKRLRKERASGQHGPELEKRIHEMEVNRCYAIYHPLDQKYVSIFASSGNDEEEESDSRRDELGNKSEKPSIWYTVEAAMARGERYLQALRTGKSDTSTDHITVHPDRAVNMTENSATSTGKSKAGSKQNKKTKQAVVSDRSRYTANRNSEEEDDESDGGFFDR